MGCFIVRLKKITAWFPLASLVLFQMLPAAPTIIQVDSAMGGVCRVSGPLPIVGAQVTLRASTGRIVSIVVTGDTMLIDLAAPISNINDTVFQFALTGRHKVWIHSSGGTGYLRTGNDVVIYRKRIIRGKVNLIDCNQPLRPASSANVILGQYYGWGHDIQYGDDNPDTLMSLCDQNGCFSFTAAGDMGITDKDYTVAVQSDGRQKATRGEISIGTYWNADTITLKDFYLYPANMIMAQPLTAILFKDGRPAVSEVVRLTQRGWGEMRYLCAPYAEYTVYSDSSGIANFQNIPLRESVNYTVHAFWRSDPVTLCSFDRATVDLTPCSTKTVIFQTTAVEENSVSLSRGNTIAARPNPFSASIGIVITSDRNLGLRTLNIFGLDGRLVRTLVPHALNGRAIFDWNGCDNLGRALAAGVYLAQVSVGGRVMEARLVLTR